MPLRFLDKATFGFVGDGFDVDFPYQMVPISGERTMLLETDASPCTLTVRKAAITRVSDFLFLGIDTPVPGTPSGRVASATLPASSLIRFTVHGEGVGMTNIRVAEQSTGIAFEMDLTISVKSVRPLRYATVFLSDIFRGDVSALLNPDSLLSKVQAVFKPQANVDVVSSGRREFVFVRADLGDPILLFVPEVLDQISNATPLSTWNSVDFVVFCCWDFDAARGNLAAFSNRRFSKPERAFVFLKHLRDPDQLAHAFAHEIGHILFLGHTNRGLMFPTADSQSKLLSPPEIEVVNPLSSEFIFT